jgi:hypothetical protein
MFYLSIKKEDGLDVMDSLCREVPNYYIIIYFFIGV